MRRRTDLEPEDRCGVPHCRSEAAITYLGVRLCNADWQRVAAMPRAKGHEELGIAKMRRGTLADLPDSLKAVTREWIPESAHA